jgi:hypothetical protein
MLQNSITFQNKPHSMSSNKALNAYRMYLAAKLHFTTDKYDITEFHAKVRVSRKAFDERNQCSLYEKFADKFDSKLEMAQYLIANFAYGAWGNTDIVYGTAESDQNFKEWNRRKQSLTQVFKTDLSKIKLEWETNNMLPLIHDLNSEFPRVPHLFQMFLGKHITLETLIIVDRFNPFLETWKKNMGQLFQEEIRRIIKTKPFIRFDEKKMKPIFVEFIKEI